MNAVSIVQTFLSNILSGNMDQALAVVSPEAQFISTRAQPNPHNPLHGTFIGKQGALDFFTGFMTLLEPGEFNITASFGDTEHCAFYGNLHHKSRKTGKSFISDWALIGKVENGLITLYHFYEDTEALKEAIS